MFWNHTIAKYQLKRRWVLLVCVAMCCMPGLAGARDEFFDKNLVISNDELEEASDIPENIPPTPGTVKPALNAVPPLAPFPVTPNIVMTVPSQHSSTSADMQVEILLEEPPLTDEDLKKTGETSQAQPVQTFVSNQGAMNSEDLIEKMLQESEQGTQGPAPATTPEPIIPEPIILEPAPIPAPQGEVVLPEDQKTLSEEAATLPGALPLPPVDEGDKPAPTTASLDTWTGSIMFSPNEYQALRQAVGVYERLTGRRAVAPSAAGGVASKTPTTANASRTPAFYLGSIAYITPEQWAVWLNNKKYTANKTTDEVNIVQVTSDNVRIRWKVDSLDIAAPGWRNKLVLNNAGYFVSGDNLVEVNNTGTEVIFILRPNQSFVSSRMKVIEGRTDEGYSLSLQ